MFSRNTKDKKLKGGSGPKGGKPLSNSRTPNRPKDSRRVNPNVRAENPKAEGKTPSEREIKTKPLFDIGLEEVELPKFNSCFGDTDTRDKVDSFIVDSIFYAESSGTIKPYFIGSKKEVSFKEHIKFSDKSFKPNDLVKDETEGIINLSKRKR